MVADAALPFAEPDVVGSTTPTCPAAHFASPHETVIAVGVSSEEDDEEPGEPEEEEEVEVEELEEEEEVEADEEEEVEVEDEVADIEKVGTLAFMNEPGETTPLAPHVDEKRFE